MRLGAQHLKSVNRPDRILDAFYTQLIYIQKTGCKNPFVKQSDVWLMTEAVTV